MIGGKLELAHIKTLVRHQNPDTPGQTRMIVECYFADMIWSQLKEEWTDKMTEDERVMVVEKLFSEEARPQHTLRTP